MPIASLARRTAPALFLLVMVALLPGFATSTERPELIYHHAWQLVRDNFYDTRFNGQSWSSWEHRYDGTLKTREQAYKAVKTMISSLNDPYTRVLDPDSYKDEMTLIDSKLVGIGITMDADEDGRMFIAETIDGGPAARSGLKVGDELVAVNGQSLEGLSIEQAGQKIGGRAGTRVLIGVNRKNVPYSFNVKRQKLVLHSVSYKALDSNIGYISISNFLFDDAARDFKTALRKLAKTSGLIIDLRHNPGGLIGNAIEMADMLLPGGRIVTTIDRHERETDVASGSPVSRQPVVLLVDKDSASASEILAGALKDNGRATIVGARTFGKGLVQEIDPLPGGGGMHLTVARYLSPKGAEINKVGIMPDVLAPGDEDAQLATAVNLLKQTIAQGAGNRLSQAVRYGAGTKGRT
jgi:carboxyl-terminal processing protease